MKKTVILILVLAVLCTALCACDVRDGVISDRDNDGGVVTDGGNGNGADKSGKDNNGTGNNGNSNNNSNKKDDDDKGVIGKVGDDIKEGIDDITGSPDPQSTAVPGTQVITP